MVSIKDVDDANIPLLHNRVANTIRLTIDMVVLGDWRTLDKDQITQAAGRLRTIKASYLNHPMHLDLLEHPALTMIDEVLTNLYLALDTLDGRDITKQQDIYRAIRNVQEPLLRALVALPRSLDAANEQAEEEEIPQNEAPASQARPLNQHHEAEETSDVLDQEETHEQSEQSKQFRWSHHRLSQLQEAMRESRQASTLAMAKEIANRFRWPVKAVEYKVYALRQSQRRPQEAQVSAREQVSAATDKEDDRQRQVAEGTENAQGTGDTRGRDAGHA